MARSVQAALLAALLAAGMTAVGVGSASAAPECDDPVATALHEGHDTLGTAGEPLHEAEQAYCGTTS